MRPHRNSAVLCAIDLRKLRGKQLIDKPARTRRYRVPALAARTIAALLTLRDQVIAPILAAVRSPRMGRKPAHWTRVDRHYERIRIGISSPVSACRYASTTRSSSGVEHQMRILFSAISRGAGPTGVRQVDRTSYHRWLACAAHTPVHDDGGLWNCIQLPTAAMRSAVVV